MEKAIKTFFFTCLVGLLIILPGNFFQWMHQQVLFDNASKAVRLTVEEQSWLKNHPHVRIAFDGSSAPYSYIDQSGQIAGIAYDTLQLIARKLDTQFEIYPEHNWQKIYKAALAQQVDVIATMVNRPERRYEFAFTQPYLFKSLVLVANKANKQINTANDLSNKTIALVKGYQYSQEVLNSLPNIKPLYVGSVEEALFAVETGRADATISFYANSSFLQNKHLLENIWFITLYDLNNATESIAVRKDWPILVNILQKGLNAITKEEQQMINQLWDIPVGLSIDQETMDNSFFMLLILFALLIWLVEVKRQNRRHKIAYQSLLTTNNNLVSENDTLNKQVLQDRKLLQDNEQKFQSLVENLHNEYFFYQHELDGPYSYLSPSITNILGYSVEQFSHHYKAYLTDHPDNEKLEKYTRLGLNGEKVPAYRLEVLDSKGNKHTLEILENPVFDKDGFCVGVCGMGHDITPLLQAREQVDLLTNYDDLTGLANSRLFADRAKHMVSLSHRQHKKLALLFLDLDAFKLVNDNFGHATGNAALQEVAHRLKTLLSDSDTAARTGGDEFALILFDSSVRAAKTVAKKTLKKLLRPFSINGHQFSIGSSIGIAIYPQDGEDCESLLDQADKAMYFAKQNNKPYAFCSPELDEQSKRRLKLEHALHIALTENNDANSPDLSLVYQSKHDIRDNSIQGYEALIHWQHPELGLITANELIPLAELSGQSSSLTRWVVEQVALQAVNWTNNGLKLNRIAINISDIEIINFKLAGDIIQQIEATGALLKWIEIEISESALIKMPDVSSRFIEQLNNANVLVTIDHFKGEISPPFLKKLATDHLKIAPSLIQNILSSPEDQSVVQALISSAHQLEKKVIVVGVENEQQLLLLKDIGADYVQGHLFSKPSTAEQIELYISEIFSIKDE